ncbi:TIGR03086 family metal-binding protein [Paractinoplanes atraurantiacus]|uniref:TIGR03086 family protein n=1 Tax=Paractinoplanes atraurantiacus TaxID=1036182 RepID=A0A285H5R2_9ACTN|nr:TIGR03086 family metal-binding protein [Actinoplanes atraurantiacus]SNY31065.1 TIGR03086 family protein [Actinoplanes atraurantiacus]
MADRVPLDFDPPVRVLRALLLGIDNHELLGPTPCPDWSVAALLDHLMGLSFAFTQTARKRADAPGTSEPPPEPSAQHLSRHWRSRLPVLLEDLATAWKEQTAWTGTSAAGGVTMPAAALGHVAMTELIVHGWDLARSTGQEYAADPRTLEILIEFNAQYPPEGTPGLFGPVRPVTDDEATLLDQLLALTGRDAQWRAPRRRPAAPAA